MRPGDPKRPSGVVPMVPGNQMPVHVPYGAARQAVAEVGAAFQATPTPHGHLPGFKPQDPDAKIIDVHQPGGDTVNKVLHPAFTPFEQFYRTLPDQIWFDPSVNPTNPIQFDLGTFRIPNNYELWLFDYEFSVYLQSGIDPYDAVPAEEGRFSGQLGFDLQVGLNKRLSNLFYQLDPATASFDRQGQAVTQATFNSAASTSASAYSSQGSSLLPVRKNVQGPRNGAFTLIGRETDRVVLSAVIFRRIMNPLAWIQGTFSGYLVQTNMSKALLDRMRPQ